MTTDTTSDSPALGSRDNFWGDPSDAAEDRRQGHTETTGTDPAEYVAHQLLLRFVDPICSQTGRPLSPPTLHLPKQHAIGDGQTLEYRQHRHRRRFEPESGRINWGETTSTDVPEVGYDIYQRCVHTYLAERDCRLTDIDEYLEYAERVWHDPSMGSRDALEQFVRKVRELENGGDE